MHIPWGSTWWVFHKALVLGPWIPQGSSALVCSLPCTPVTFRRLELQSAQQDTGIGLRSCRKIPTDSGFD